MAFDAGAIESRLTIDTSTFDRDMDAAEARVKRFEDTKHEVKLSAVFDSSSLSRARQQFAQLDNQISKDAMSRLRSNPQGSVLGALNALFSPHPVTGAPSPTQAAQQGLLGKIVSAPGGGGTPGPSAGNAAGSTVSQVLGGNTGTAQSNANQRVSTVGLPQNTTTTDKVNVVGAPTNGNITTTDRVNTVGLPSNNAITTEDRVNVTGLPVTGGTITTEDKVKPELDESSVRQDAGKAGKDAADAANEAAGEEAKRKGSGWFAGMLSGISGMVTKALGDALGGGGSGGKGGGGSGSLAGGILGGIGPSILGIGLKATAITGAVGTALAALPALGGVVGAGVGTALIGGLIAGVVAGSPGLKAEFSSIGKQAADVLKQAGAPIIPAIQGILRQVPGLLKSIEPQLAGVFKTVAPELQGVFAGLVPVVKGLLSVIQAAAPAFGPFIGALEKLVAGLFPGLAAVTKAVVPVMTQFGTIMGQLGSNLGALFGDLAPAVGASMTVLGALFGLIGGLLPVVAKLADVFAVDLAPVITAFAGTIRALSPALTSIGTIIADLAGAMIGDLASAFGALAKLLTGIAPGLNAFATAIGQVFTVLENTGTFAILGAALENLAAPLAKLVNTLLTGLVPILPPVIGFIGQLSALLATTLANAVQTLLPPLTTLVTAVLQALNAILPVILPLLLSFAGVFTGALVSAVSGVATALAAVINAMPPAVLAGIVIAIAGVIGAMKLWGLATVAVQSGMAKIAASAFGSAIASAAAVLGDFAAAAEGASVAETAMVGASLALEAVSPFAWAAVGVGLLGALTVALIAVSAQSQTIVGSFQQQQQHLDYNISSYQKLAGTVATASAGYAKFAASSTDAVRGGAAGATTLANQLSQQSQAISAAGVAMLTRVTALSKGLGVSQTVIEQWAHAAGISAATFSGTGESVGKLTGQIVGFVNSNAQAVTAASSLGTNIAIFGNDVFNTTTQLDAFNQIWNTLVGNLLTKQQAVTQSQQSFDNLKQSIADNGKASTQTQASFQAYIQQIQSSLDALQKGGASVSTLNSYLQTQIGHLESLGPLNKSEQADLAGLKAVQDALANSTNGLNAQQKTMISQFETGLIPSLQQMNADTPKVTGDISNLTNAIIQTGAHSAATAGDRAKLIADLEQAGVKASVATGFVNGLEGSIGNLKGKVVNVGVTATAQGTLNAIAHLPGVATSTSSSLVFAAGGMMVSGGTPGKDSVLAMLMPGEVVVPTAMVQGGAVDHLRGSIPGFAAGGLVNLDQPGQWTAGQEGSWGQQTANAWAQGVKSSFEAAAAKAATAAAAQFVATQGASGGIIQSLMKNMAAARGWTGAEWDALAAVEQREAGFCLTINHMILTKRGWLKHDEVIPGDETIGFNPETGKSEWTRVTAVHHYENEPVVTYGNKFWQATFTPGHRWLTEARLRSRPLAGLAVCPECGFTGKSEKLGIRNHMVRSHGWAKATSRAEEEWQKPQLTPWNEFTGQERIILSRPADTGPGLPITDREAALLGWIAGDGCVMENRLIQKKARPAPPANWQERTEDAPFGLRRDGTPRKSAGGRPYKDLDRTSAPGTSGLSVTIAQSKTEHFAAIEDALTGIAGVGRYTQDTRGRTPGTGFGVTNLVSRRWRLPAAYAYDLIARAGHPKKDAFEQVTRMSASQRHAWLEAMIAAEGTVHVPEPGKPKDGRKTVIYQNDGPIADAIELAVYLEGYRPGRNRLGKAREVAIRPTAPHVGGPQRLSFTEDAGTADVWCVTTELGSWTACNESGMFLTGNSMTATNPTSGAYGLAQFINGPSEYAQYGGNSTTAIGQVTGMLNYIAQRYGDPIAAWNHEVAYGWYDHGGSLNPGYTLAYNGTGRAEQVVSGASVSDLAARLDQLHADMREMVTATRQVPAGVGAHVGGAISGAASDASFRSRYPRSN